MSPLVVRVEGSGSAGMEESVFRLPFSDLQLDRFVRCIDGLLHATAPAGFKIAAKPVPLSDVEQAWPKDNSTRRTVFTVEVRKS